MLTLLSLNGTIQSWSRGAERLYGYAAVLPKVYTRRARPPMGNCDRWWSRCPQYSGRRTKTLRITSNWGAGFGASKLKERDLVGGTLYDYLKCQDPHAVPIAQHAKALRGVSSYVEYRHGNRHFAVHLSPLRAASGGVASARASTSCTGRRARIRPGTKRSRIHGYVGD
jgi:hypothetical protein